MQLEKHPNQITLEEGWELAGDKAPGYRVQFFDEPQFDQVASKKAGRPIYVDQLCVAIKVNGEKDTTVVRATKRHMNRHRAEYQE